MSFLLGSGSNYKMPFDGSSCNIKVHVFQQESGQSHAPPAGPHDSDSKNFTGISRVAAVRHLVKSKFEKLKEHVQPIRLALHYLHTEELNCGDNQTFVPFEGFLCQILLPALKVWLNQISKDTFLEIWSCPPCLSLVCDVLGMLGSNMEFPFLKYFQCHLR